MNSRRVATIALLGVLIMRRIVMGLAGLLAISALLYLGSKDSVAQAPPPPPKYLPENHNCLIHYSVSTFPGTTGTGETVDEGDVDCLTGERQPFTRSEIEARVRSGRCPSHLEAEQQCCIYAGVWIDCRSQPREGDGVRWCVKVHGAYDPETGEGGRSELVPCDELNGASSP